MLTAQTRLAARLKGKVVFLLLIMLFLHVSYPFSERGQAEAVFYLLIYCGMLGFGVYLVGTTRLRFIVTLILTIITVVIGSVFIASPGESLAVSLTTFGLLTLFLVTLTVTLFEYVFNAEKITRDVLFSATAVYLLLGNIFTTSYVFLDFLTHATMGMSAFSIGGDSTALVPWQKLFYYSYTTLTTLGYGDVLPATSVAQSLATLEATIGVLYITILIGRLVGLYSQHND